MLNAPALQFSQLPDFDEFDGSGEDTPVGAGGSSKPQGQIPSALTLDPYQFCPPFGVDLEADALNQLMNAGANQVIQPGLSSQIPFATGPLEVAVVKTVNCLVDGPGTISTATNVLFWVTGNNIPISPAYKILGRTGVNNVARIFDPVTLRIPPNTAVGVKIQNQDGAIYTVSVQLTGWKWQAVFGQNAPPSA